MLLTISVCVCSLLAFGRGAWGREWVISPDGNGDAPTIQAGIDSASAADTVLALPGEYFENIDFKGKAIVVMGSGREFTTINAGGQGSCVVFKNGEGNGSILSGFTLEEGAGQYIGGSYWGGGIYGFGSEPTIDGNIIEHNEASVISNGDYRGRGGGLYFIQDVPPKSPIIQNNIIRFNRAGGNGGGLLSMEM